MSQELKHHLRDIIDGKFPKRPYIHAPVSMAPLQEYRAQPNPYDLPESRQSYERDMPECDEPLNI